MGLLLAWLIGTSVLADVFVAEAPKNECKRLTANSFGKYLLRVKGDTALESTHDEGGVCGEALFITKKSNRRRWYAFPTKKNCECYVEKMKSILPVK